MHPVLQSAYARVLAELEGVDTAAAQLHPNGKEHRWTMQQQVEHLCLCAQQCRVGLEKRLEKNRLPHRTPRTWLERAMQLMVLSLGYMPAGVPAQEETTPNADLPLATGRELGRKLAIELELLDAALDRCRSRFGMERIGQNFLLGPLRVDQLRRYQCIHLRHHAKQMRIMRESLRVEIVARPAMVKA